MTMWSLTLPPLAATLVAYDMFNPAAQRLIDSRLLNVVLPQALPLPFLDRFSPSTRAAHARSPAGSGEGGGNRLIQKMQQLLNTLSRPLLYGKERSKDLY